MHALAERRAKPVLVGKGEGKIVCPAGMAGDEIRAQAACLQLCLQLCQRADRQLVVLR